MALAQRRAMGRQVVIAGVCVAVVACASLVVACSDGYDVTIPVSPLPPPFTPPPTATGPASARTLPPEPCAGAEVDTSCHQAGTPVCETKLFANVSCNATLECESIFYQWKKHVPMRSCATTAAMCPSSSAGSTDVCSSPLSGATICEYPEGTCGCAPTRAPDAVDGGVDAGETSSTSDAGPTSYVWKCIPAQEGCPRARPASGEGCVRPIACDYGDCVFKDGVKMRCNGHHWAAEQTCHWADDL